MMRSLVIICFTLIASCSDNKKARNENHTTLDTVVSDIMQASPVQKDTVVANKPVTYANARFKNVTVSKVGTDTYRLAGEGQIFEASFNWVVEEGHNELKSGYTTTDAGAPAWGKFSFTVQVRKARANSVLHIILFEASAEDGRRTHELPIVLK